MKKFSKEERIVVLGGLLLILLVIGFGLVKKEVIDCKKEPYHSIVAKETKEPTKAKAVNMELKQSAFTVEVNGVLSKKADTYISASQTVLHKAKLDLDSVDMSVPGSYTGTITYKQETLDISILVKDSQAPVITTAHDQVPFTIEANSTVEEIKEYVNASAEDAYDGFIGADKITGWPTELPKEAGSFTYTLQVKDASGNIGKKDITVDYTMKKEASGE